MPQETGSSFCFPITSRSPDDQGPKLRIALADLLNTQRIHAWFWGHEHRLVLYDPHPSGVSKAVVSGTEASPGFETIFRTRTETSTSGSSCPRSRKRPRHSFWTVRISGFRRSRKDSVRTATSYSILTATRYGKPIACRITLACSRRSSKAGYPLPALTALVGPWNDVRSAGESARPSQRWHVKRPYRRAEPTSNRGREFRGNRA